MHNRYIAKAVYKNKYKVFWQTQTSRRLNDEDIRQINTNLAGFFSILSEWKRNAK